MVEIASQHEVKVNTVYNWINKSLHGSGGSLLATAKLKRENLYLKQLLGQLMLDIERGKKINMVKQAISKLELAQSLGISVSSLYYQPKHPAIDEEVRRQIESVFHNCFLVMGVILNALENYSPPEIIHSDQGSEYGSQDFTDLVESLNTKMSMSRKGSPWENGHQESFFGYLKGEGGDLNRFASDGELLEEWYQMIYYYNHKRIHSKLKMPPMTFHQIYLLSGINMMS